jgi:hypothetical protein
VRSQGTKSTGPIRGRSALRPARPFELKLRLLPGGSSFPPEGRSSLEEGKSSPSEGRSSPSEGKSSPSEGRSSPQEGKSSPSEGRSSPPEGKSSPSEGKSSPSEEKTSLEGSPLRRRRGACNETGQGAARSLRAQRGAQGMLRQCTLCGRAP